MRNWLIVVLIIMWIYSGWPKVWHTPSMPPYNEKAKAASGDVILLWDGASSAPTGWTCVSCNPGDAFYQVFPRASSSYATASSSSDTHSHTASFVSHTVGASILAFIQPQYAGDTHTHTVSGITVASSDHKPPFRNLKFIMAQNPSSLPAGIIGMFDVASSSLPSGWSYYSGMENNYLRGENSSSTGGAVEHTHLLTATADSPNDKSRRAFGNGSSIATDTHTHSISGNITNASNTPPYIEMVFAKLDADTGSVTAGLIAMFDAASPSGWTIVSTNGSAYDNKLLKGSDTYGATGGSATHTHATSTITSGPASASVTTGNQSYAAAAGNHTHDFTFNNFSVETSFPIFRDVVLGKKDAASATVSCSTDIASTDFGALSSASISTSAPNASTTITCSGTANGCTLFTQSMGDGMNGGLWNSTSSALIESPDAVFSATTTLASGTEGYGIRATTTSSGSGGTLTLNLRYDISKTNGLGGSINDIGGLATTTITVASSTVDITSREVVVTHKAVISAETPSGTYDDTITYSCTAN